MLVTYQKLIYLIYTVDFIHSNSVATKKHDFCVSIMSIVEADRMAKLMVRKMKYPWIFILFMDAVRVSEYSVNKWWIGKDLEVDMANSRYSATNCLEWLKKKTKTIMQISRSYGWDLNTDMPTYGAWTFLIQMWCLGDKWTILLSKEMITTILYT